MGRATFLLAGMLVCGIAAGQSIITTVAGTEPVFRGAGGPATNATLDLRTVAADGAGNLYAIDSGTRVIRITRNGTLEVVAGNGIPGYSGDGGPALRASLSGPRDVTADADGNLYIADSGNSRVRRVSPAGIITTIAGTGQPAAFEDPGVHGDGGPATAATLTFPDAVTLDAAGNLYVLDGSQVLRIGRDGILHIVAGSGEFGHSGDGGLATNAGLDRPDDLAVDAAGNLYIADRRRIRRVGLGGVIQTIAGSGEVLSRDFEEGVPALEAQLNVDSVAVDATGNIFLTDFVDVRVLRISPAGTIQTVAGNGESGFSGDGGPAREASLASPGKLAIDSAGDLFVADQGNERIRKISSDDIIETVAGGGRLTFTGEGEPATNATLARPEGIALDLAGNLFIADGGHNSVHQVGRDGIIRTVAGTGDLGFLGDGGSATDAALSGPTAVTVDALGNLFIADERNFRVRRVDAGGVIRTVAGDGEFGAFGDGDGGPAVDASLTRPTGLAVDSAGNLLIADSGDIRVREVGPDGLIRTVVDNAGAGMGGFELRGSIVDGTPDVAANAAGDVFVADNEGHRILHFRAGGSSAAVALVGDGRGSFRGDDGPAINASLLRPISVAVDSRGSLYIGDGARVRQVDPFGIIRTVAGNGSSDSAGDGLLATEASVGEPRGLAVDSAGNLFIADSSGDRVRVVLAEQPRFGELRAEGITLTSPSGGVVVEAEPVLINASAANLPLLRSPGLAGMPFSATILDGDDWLSISPGAGVTPRLLRIKADPAGLAPGEFRGQIRIELANAQPAERTLDVSFLVGPPVAPRLAVDAESFSFTYSTNPAARAESFSVLNQGTGDLPFAVAAETDSGGDWLTVAPGQRNATPNQPATVEVKANPAGLPAGTYSGRVRVTAEAEGSPVTIPVTMTVSEADQAIFLTQRGLSFTAVEQGGITPPQTFGVTNLGGGAMSWSVTTCTVTGFSCDWLRVTPDGGASDPADETPQVAVIVDQTGLAPGAYYGLVEVRAERAANSPHVVTVFLEVLPAGSDPGAALANNDLIFTVGFGGDSPGSQEIVIYNVAAAPKSFRTSVMIDDPAVLKISPREGRVDPREPTRVVVQPFVSEGIFVGEEPAPPGEYDGDVTLQFSDGRVQQVGVKFVVTETGSSGALSKAQNVCTPTQLIPAIKTLGDNFAVSGGWPVGLQVEVTDDCGRPQNEGSVVVEFSNGDPQIAMTSLRNGRWDGTWQTNPRTLSDVTIRVDASMPGLGIRGASEVRGGLRAIQQAPVVPQAGIVGAATPVSHQPLAPGSLISIFGLGLSDGRAAADALPLPEALQSTSMFIAGEPMPLLFSSDGQVNAMVPYGLAVNTNHQIVVQRGPTLSRPVAVNLAATQPAVFLTTPGGTQGHIYKFLNGAQILADSTNPATEGDVLVMYCSGLGEVDPPVAAGFRAGADPLSRTVSELTVLIGAQRAAVAFSGLAPGFSGLYQVNVVLPAGVSPGAAVPVTLTISGQTSAAATIAVR